MKSRGIVFTIILMSISLIILTSFGRSEEIAYPLWLKPGATIVYYGRLGIGEGVLEATVKWYVRNIDANNIILESTIESTSLRTSISRVFSVSVDTGRILSINGEDVDPSRFFLWIYPPPNVGDVVEIEGIQYRITRTDRVNASNRVWECIVANATIDNTCIRGSVVRWYDIETGVQVRVYMKLSFTYKFKGENTTSSAETDLIVLSISS
ncbi:MAG: hypothetical protein QW695_03805 [Candidatus Bathyarchaeia archaeon]